MTECDVIRYREQESKVRDETDQSDVQQDGFKSLPAQLRKNQERRKKGRNETSQMAPIGHVRPRQHRHQEKDEKHDSEDTVLDYRLNEVKVHYQVRDPESSQSEDDPTCSNNLITRRFQYSTHQVASDTRNDTYENDSRGSVLMLQMACENHEKQHVRHDVLQSLVLDPGDEPPLGLAFFDDGVGVEGFPSV